MLRLPSSFRLPVSTLALTALLTIGASVARAQQVYSNDFSVSAGSEWSDPTISTAPSGEKFLADSANGSGAKTNTLTLSSLASHSAVTVDFDLYIINTMDGNGPAGGGPDFWQLMANGNTLLNTTFANYTGGNTQAFQDQSHTSGSYAPRTGESDAGHLGYGTGDSGDATYHLSYTFADTVSSLALAFTSLQNQGVGDEGWGLDNVTVTLTPTAGGAVPEPGNLAVLMGMGMSGAGFLARRKKAHKSA